MPLFSGPLNTILPMLPTTLWQRQTKIKLHNWRHNVVWMLLWWYWQDAGDCPLPISVGWWLHSPTHRVRWNFLLWRVALSFSKLLDNIFNSIINAYADPAIPAITTVLMADPALHHMAPFSTNNASPKAIKTWFIILVLHSIADLWLTHADGIISCQFRMDIYPIIEANSLINRCWGLLQFFHLAIPSTAKNGPSPVTSEDCSFNATDMQPYPNLLHTTFQLCNTRHKV